MFSKTSIVISLSFIFVFLLQIMPIPPEFIDYRPDWLLLVIIYWTLIFPYRVNIGIAFFLGILLDLIEGSTLGIHALAFCVIVYLASFRLQSIRGLRLWQQMGVIFFLSILYILFLFCIEFLIDNELVFKPRTLIHAFINCICWGWIYLFLQHICYKMQIVN